MQWGCVVLTPELVLEGKAPSPALLASGGFLWGLGL